MRDLCRILNGKNLRIHVIAKSLSWLLANYYISNLIFPHDFGPLIDTILYTARIIISIFLYRIEKFEAGCQKN